MDFTVVVMSQEKNFLSLVFTLAVERSNDKLKLAKCRAAELD